MILKLHIDFVSDISCPWCIIGLRALEVALDRARDVVTANIAFQPFELNPHMPREGENVVEHVTQKYGSTPEQSAANRTMISERAAELGFAMNGSAASRIYNTFDAHRLLYWAALHNRQAALKEALFVAYFTDQRDPLGLMAVKPRESWHPSASPPMLGWRSNCGSRAEFTRFRQS
jgi:predicted DsbA family dithiol-disulfide isomerase